MDHQTLVLQQGDKPHSVHLLEGLPVDVREVLDFEFLDKILVDTHHIDVTDDARDGHRFGTLVFLVEKSLEFFIAGGLQLEDGLPDLFPALVLWLLDGQDLFQLVYVERD